MPPLRTTRSLFQCIVRDILTNNFIKFNIHSRLQGYGLPAQQELTLVKGILIMPMLFLEPMFIGVNQYLQYL